MLVAMTWSVASEAAEAAAQDANLNSNPPDIEFVETEHVFGDVFKGEEANHVFTVKNVGGQPLELFKVRTSCGCTAAILTERIIAPGETGEIKVSYDTLKGTGPVEKSITVVSNDPDEESVDLLIRLNILVEIDVMPNRVYFGTIFADQEENSRVIRVTSPNLEDLQVFKVEVDSPHIGHEIKNATNGSNGKDITFMVKDSAPLGDFRAQATIHTNSEKQETVVIPISAKIYGDLQINPLKLYLAPHYPDQVREDRLTIRDRSGEGGFQIEGIVDKNGYLNVRTETIKEGEEYSIIVSTNAEAIQNRNSGQYSGVLEIITNREDEKKLSVNYSGFIKAADTRAAN